jgi:hypothetical protein
LSGSPFSAPGSPEVRPTAVFDGLICATGTSFRIGIEIALAPELNSPM